MRVVVLSAVLVMAGCIGGPSGGGEDVGPAAAPQAALVDPLAALEAGEASANLNVLGAWADDGGQEAAVWGPYLYVDTGREVAILDASDAANLVEVGRVTGFPGVLDVKVSDDGRYVFVGEDQEASSAPVGGNGPFTGGFYVVDVTDPASPQHVTYLPIGPRRGPHMVFYHRYPSGEEILFGANADVSIVRFDRAAGTLEELSRYSPNLVTDFNRSPEVVDVLYQGWAHDMFVSTEPDGRVLMYVANWDAGIRIVDVTDPTDPRELGGWNDFPEGHEGNLHTVSAAWIGDRRIAVGAVEVGFGVVGGYHYARGTDLSVVYVWDATDPADIQLLGQWVNPVEPYSGRDQVPGERVSSTHNLQLEGGRVYLAHYTLGTWVLDVSTPENQTEPVIVAYAIPQDGSVWDVVLREGVMFTSGSAGIEALHFVLDPRGPEGITSRA